MRAKADRGVVLGAFALFASLFVFGAAVSRTALGVTGGGLLPPVAKSAKASQPVADVAQPSVPAEGLVAIPAVSKAIPTAVSSSLRDAVPPEVLSLAVERAPFDPDRQTPSQRYLLPDQIVAPPREATAPERPAPPQFRILGTVAAPTGSVAVVQLADGATRVMSVGQEMEGYRVNAIENGAVVMSGRGWDLTFAVADAQPIGAGRPQRDENGRIIQQTRGQENRGQQNRVQAGNAYTIERAAVLERLQLGGDVQVEMMNNGRAVIMGPNGARREIQIPVPPPGTSSPEMIFFKRPVPAGGGR